MKIIDNLNEQIKDKDDFFYYYYKLKGGSDYANVSIEFEYEKKTYFIKETPFNEDNHKEILPDCGDWSIRELYLNDCDCTPLKTYRFLREALEDKFFDGKSIVELLNQRKLVITKMSS